MLNASGQTHRYVLVLLAFGLLLASCSDPKATADFSTVLGTARFVDHGRSSNEFLLEVHNVPDFGTSTICQGWLPATDGTFLSLGPLDRKADGTMALVWDSPNGENLVLHHRGFQATLEPIGGSATPSGKVVFSGRLGETTLALFGESSAPSPVAVGLKQQGDDAIQHAGMAQGAQEIQAWDERNAHLEHVVNILEGKNGARFGDYLGSGTPQNPGDGYGVLTYARDVLRLLHAQPTDAEKLDGLEKSLMNAAREIEDLCLAVIALKTQTKSQAMVQKIQDSLKEFHKGPMAELGQLASEGLTFAVGPAL